MTDPAPVILTLPWAPSCNHYIRHAQIPIARRCPACKASKTRVSAYISPEGKQWLLDADAAIRAAGNRPMEGLLEVWIELYPPNRRIIDCDNRTKPVLDALKRRPKDEKQTAWLFADDDSQVRRVHAGLNAPAPGGKCVVTVKALPVTQGELAFTTPEEAGYEDDPTS